MIKQLIYTAFAIVAVTSGMAGAAEHATDPVIGTWKLNAAKSTFNKGPAIKSQTRTYSQSGPNISLVMKTAAADGMEVTTQTTYQLDGKDYPVKGSADYDSLSGQQVDANTARFTLKKGGKTVGTTSRMISKDGKTLTSKMKITSAKGEESDGVLVFDKQ